MVCRVVLVLYIVVMVVVMYIVTFLQLVCAERCNVSPLNSDGGIE